MPKNAKERLNDRCSALLQPFREHMSVEDMLVALTSCQRHGNEADPCQMTYLILKHQLVIASQVVATPSGARCLCQV
jgi:hypothetical protein